MWKEGEYEVAHQQNVLNQVKNSRSSELSTVVNDALDRDRWRQIIRFKNVNEAHYDPQT